MENEMKEHLTDENIWMRGLYMVLFAIFYSLAEILFSAVAIFQFLFVLFTGNKNKNLLNFGKSLSKYVYQIVMFFTFNSEEKPYPFNSWPIASEEEAGTEKAPSEEKVYEKKETVAKEPAKQAPEETAPPKKAQAEKAPAEKTEAKKKEPEKKEAAKSAPVKKKTVAKKAAPKTPKKKAEE